MHQGVSTFWLLPSTHVRAHHADCDADCEVGWPRVTEENKREYVNLVARHRMTTAIKLQINSFLEGFWDLVPKVSTHICLSV